MSPGANASTWRGGDSAVLDGPDGRRFTEFHALAGEPLHPARDELVRRPCGMFEFHAVLVDTRRLRQVAPLDPGLRSVLEHIDLGLDLRSDGGEMWFEPGVSVTYLPGAVRRGDARRSFVAVERRVERRERPALPGEVAAPDRRRQDRAEHRVRRLVGSRAYRPYRSPFVRWARRHDRYPRSVIDRLAQRDARRWYDSTVAAAGPPRLVHRPRWLEVPADA